MNFYKFLINGVECIVGAWNAFQAQSTAEHYADDENAVIENHGTVPKSYVDNSECDIL